MRRLLSLRGGHTASLVHITLASYHRAMQEAPLRTNCVTSAVLSVLSDRIAQSVERSGRTGQTRSMWAFVWGALCSVLLTPWYSVLGAWFPLARTSWLQLIAKLLTNQALLAPGLNTLFFFYVIITQVSPPLRMNASKRSQLDATLRRELPNVIMR